MTKQQYLESPAAIDGSKLWDEILKAIISVMPSQLFPLFKEVYGREYPEGTTIIVLSSETSSFQENNAVPPRSSLMDISLLVAGTDYYHLECQMKNDKEMGIRMFAYDVRFAITHTKTVAENTGEITLYFPRSVVIYPEQNNAIPEHLQCRVVFQDNSEHIYKIPTVKVQTYSLEEIRRKHLTLFIPYTVLRLRPKLAPNIAHKLTYKELTGFVEKVILVLEEELSAGYLSERDYHNYVRLFRFAINRVLAKYPHMREEVDQMMEHAIKLPSEIWDELESELADKKAEIEDKKAELEDKKAEISKMKAELENKQAEIAARDSELASNNAEWQHKLAQKNAEIQRLQQLIDKLTYDKEHISS